MSIWFKLNTDFCQGHFKCLSHLIFKVLNIKKGHGFNFLPKYLNYSASMTLSIKPSEQNQQRISGLYARRKVMIFKGIWRHLN